MAKDLEDWDPNLRRRDIRVALGVPSGGSGGVVLENVQIQGDNAFGLTLIGTRLSMSFVSGIDYNNGRYCSTLWSSLFLSPDGVSLLRALFGTCFGENSAMAMRCTAQDAPRQSLYPPLSIYPYY